SRYLVTNTRNAHPTRRSSALDKIGSISCGSTNLAAGASMTCTMTGTATTVGQYTNEGCVAAKSPAGATLKACDPDHYYGEEPKIAIVKKTNGSDNDAAPGPIVAAGSTVTWTYTVTNTGNVDLANLTGIDE